MIMVVQSVCKPFTAMSILWLKREHRHTANTHGHRIFVQFVQIQIVTSCPVKAVISCHVFCPFICGDTGRWYTPVVIFHRVSCVQMWLHRRRYNNSLCLSLIICFFCYLFCFYLEVHNKLVPYVFLHNIRDFLYIDFVIQFCMFISFILRLPLLNVNHLII